MAVINGTLRYCIDDGLMKLFDFGRELFGIVNLSTTKSAFASGAGLLFCFGLQLALLIIFGALGLALWMIFFGTLLLALGFPLRRLAIVVITWALISMSRTRCSLNGER